MNSDHVAGQRRAASQRGVTLVEMMIALSIMLVASAMYFMTIQPALKQARLTNAYNTTLMTMRKARERAVNQQRVYIVSFIAPGTITITQADNGLVVNTFQLPSDIQFATQAGFPNTVATTPDHFGTASTAIDFDQGVAGGNKTQIYFQPDGSAQDINNSTNNGVVYLTRPGEIYSSRAITLWGTTGRLRGWRLYNAGGNNNSWVKQ